MLEEQAKIETLSGFVNCVSEIRKEWGRRVRGVDLDLERIRIFVPKTLLLPAILSTSGFDAFPQRDDKLYIVKSMGSAFL